MHVTPTSRSPSPAPVTNVPAGPASIARTPRTVSAAWRAARASRTRSDSTCHGSLTGGRLGLLDHVRSRAGY